ncbi:hypothetical protein GCM10017562_02310 [Streptomyces roseofulvus]
MRQLAPLFGISPATVCRVIRRLRRLPARERAPRPVADTERLWIVDCTLVPVRDRKVGASFRNHRDGNGLLIVVGAHPFHGIGGRPAFPLCGFPIPRAGGNPCRPWGPHARRTP